MGLVRFAYRCDREASLNAMAEDAISKAGRTAKTVHSDSPEDLEQPVAEEEEPDSPTFNPQTPSAPYFTGAERQQWTG